MTRKSINAGARVTRNGVEGVTYSEVDPGRSVPNDWENGALIERWEDRKARRAAERVRGAA